MPKMIAYLRSLKDGLRTDKMTEKPTASDAVIYNLDGTAQPIFSNVPNIMKDFTTARTNNVLENLKGLRAHFIFTNNQRIDGELVEYDDTFMLLKIRNHFSRVACDDLKMMRITNLEYVTVEDYERKQYLKEHNNEAT